MSQRMTRRRLLAAAGTVALAGCASAGSSSGGRRNEDGDDGSGPDQGGSGGSSPPSPTDTTPTDTSGGTGPPIASYKLPIPKRPDILRGRAQSGGVPKDGIPSIDSPSFVDPDSASGFLDDEDIVFGITRDGEAKAYPQSVLVWHEICNDSIAGDPVSVTYCPLTGTALGFERGDTEFGVSGSLLNNNLIMYDRATENWWPQVLATAIPGWGESFVGRSLQEFRVIWTTWDRWREAHPDTEVLSTNTGMARDYNRDPYGNYNPVGGYYRLNEDPMFSPLHRNDDHPPKQVFIGARGPEGGIAVKKDRLREDHLIEGSMGDVPVVAVYDENLDTGYVYRNPDEVSLTYSDGMVEGPDGTVAPGEVSLEAVTTFDAMWFAWYGFYPDSEIHA